MVKAFTIKPDVLYLIPRTHVVEGKTDSLRFPADLHVPIMMVHFMAFPWYI